jgi:hypothetical protein
MTRASEARKLRRERRRKDISNDPDRIAIEFALALKAAWGMSERAAFDLAVAWCEARVTDPTKTPRGVKAGLLVGYDRVTATITGRASTLRRKSKRHSPRPDVVRALILALRCCRDIDAAHRLFEQLLMLAAVTGPDRLHRVVAELVAQIPSADGHRES